MNTTDTSAITLAPITVDLSLSFGVGECRSNDELLNEPEEIIEEALERVQESACALFRERAEDCTWMLDFDISVLLYDTEFAVHPDKEPHVFTERDRWLWDRFHGMAVLIANTVRSFTYQEPVILEAVRDIYREMAEEDREWGYRD